MFVKYPHDFCRVHCAAAAERDYAVGSERRHLLCAFCRTAEGRVGSNVKEGRMLDSHFVKPVGYRLCVSVMIEEAVGYDKRPLFVHYGFKLAECNRQTAFLYIYLFRSSEPKHIFPSFRNGFNIYKVLYANIFGNRVSSP